MTRLRYVDNLRSLCMLLGIFVHTSRVADFGAVSGVAQVSDWFRMATFFILSGFFSAMMFEKRGAGFYYAHRIRGLALPFLTTMVVLGPVTFWLIAAVRYPDLVFDLTPAGMIGAARFLLASGDSVAPWHLHLWFLISLLCYVLVAPAFCRLFSTLGADAISAWLVGRLPPVLLVPVMAGGVALLTLALRVVMELGLNRLIGDHWIVTTTVMYFPMFALGLLLYLHPALWQAMHRIDLVAVLMAVALAGASHALASVDGRLVEAVLVLAKAVGRVAISCALLKIGRDYLNREGPAWIMLSQSIYTVYLVHYFLVFLLGWMIIDAEGVNLLTYFAIAFETILIAVSFHVFAVACTRSLTLLLNGRWVEAAQPMPALLR